MDDGRLSYDGDADGAIYPLDDGGIEIYGINEEGEGFPAADLAALPQNLDKNLLIAEFGDIAFYKLTTGEYQVNVGPDEEGKVQVYILNNELTTIVHRADFNVYDIVE